MSSSPVIECHGIGKKYHIGELRSSKQSLNDLLINSLISPYRRLQSLRRTHLPDGTGQEIWALRNITFNVQKGEIFGIIGANGSGKSTLLKIIAHVVQPTEGYAITRGRINTLLEAGTGFHEDLTGRENLYVNGAILGMTRPQIDTFFDAIIEFAEIEKFIDTPIKRYSSGMRLRLAFAVSIFLSPEIMIFDEVLQVGDPAFREKCINQITKTAVGRSVLIVAHDLSQIRRLCDRVMWLDQGQIVELGETPFVVKRFEERFLSRLASLYKDRSQLHLERLGEDLIMLNEGWYALETANHMVFRWATNDAQIVILNATGVKRKLALDLEVGPGSGSGSATFSLVDECDQRVVGQRSVYGRQRVTFELPITHRKDAWFFRLQIDNSDNISVPGDRRILNFRVFNFDWT